MDVVPDDRVVLAGGDRASDGKDKFRIERALQQLADVATFVVVGQVGTSTSARVRHAGIGMSFLASLTTTQVSAEPRGPTVKNSLF